ncbi:MAG TPA: glycosyltransferase [Gemmatimonadales bacterium]|nr:glycosyltransferase [Gemmatimonadales bacterium]
MAPQPFYQDRGTPIALRQVLRALSELGRAVDLLTYPIGKDVEIAGLRILRSGNPFRFESVPIGLSLRKIVLDVPLTVALRGQLARERYTCVHAVEESAFPAAIYARQHGIPLLYDMQSSIPEQVGLLGPLSFGPTRRMLDAAEQWLLSQSNVVVTSAGLASRVRQMVPSATVREWHFASAAAGADPKDVGRLRQSLGLGPQDRVVLYSGTFEAYQGLPDLIAAIPLVRERCPQATFVFVGAERSEPELASAVPHIESGALRVVDRQPRHEMPAFLAMADVLVSARAYGGNLPLKIFDYLAASRPIVATDIPTHRTVLSEERAVLVEPRTEALAEGILGVLADPERAQRLATAGRQYAKAHLGWGRFVQSVSELYDEVERHAVA